MRRAPSTASPENTDNVQKFIGTAYDDVKLVGDNIDAVVSVANNLVTIEALADTYAGFTLIPGPEGDPGPTGPQGAPGDTGPAGPQGMQGVAGPAGTPGADGSIGPAGPAGADGLDGADGPQGPAGVPGATGPAGADGAVGPTGPQGVAGTPGAAGATGPQGIQGIQGNQGIQGIQGAPGAAAVITTDSVDNTHLANMAGGTMKGRPAGTTGDPQDLTAVQVRTLIDSPQLSAAQNFGAAQGVAPVALTDAATIDTDAALSNVFTVTLGGNRTLGNPSNLVAGRTYAWVISQDGTGSRTLAFSSFFDFPGGTAPTISGGANDVDMLVGIAISTTRVLCVANLDFS